VEFQYAFKQSSAVTNRADATEMSFSPDTKREPTYFSRRAEARASSSARPSAR
jgi:hypothetical protein